MQDRHLLTISELAKLTNVSTNKIRYYEKEGLLKASHRSEGGYRLYDEEDVYRLCDIIILRDYGLTVRSIKQLIHNYNEKEYYEAIRGSYRRTLDQIEHLEGIKKRIEQDLAVIHTPAPQFEIKTLPKRRFVVIKASPKFLDYSIKELYDCLSQGGIDLTRFYNEDFYFHLDDMVSFCIQDDDEKYSMDAVIKDEGNYLCYRFFVLDEYDKEQRSSELYDHLKDYNLNAIGSPFLIIRRQNSMMNRPGYMAELQIMINQ